MARFAGLAVWVLISLSAGFIGSRFPPGEWYRSLEKPSWNPPDAVFAPVWTGLYLLMAVAAWIVWTRKGFGFEIGLFLTQLALNALWSWLFFGLRRPGAAFAEITVLWLLILACLLAFRRVSVTAGVLLIPYLLWVGFASVLNYTLWRMNA